MMSYSTVMHGKTWTDSYYYNLIALPRAASFAHRRARLAALLPLDS